VRFRGSIRSLSDAVPMTSRIREAKEGMSVRKHEKNQNAAQILREKKWFPLKFTFSRSIAGRTSFGFSSTIIDSTPAIVFDCFSVYFA
jgi:hypothetical protein